MKNELEKLYHLKANPFAARARIDAPMVGRVRERAAWEDIINTKAGGTSNSLNFIIGDYGMGKSHSLYHIKLFAEQKNGITAVFIKLLREDEVRYFGMDFVRRIFKTLDPTVRAKLGKLKTGKAFEVLPEHADVIKRFGSGDAGAVAALTEGSASKQTGKTGGVARVLKDTESAIEFLAALMSMLKDSGFRALVVCVDEAEYVFSQTSAKKAAQIFNTLRSIYDLPDGTPLGLSLQPMSNLIFFFGISGAGMTRLTTMEKVESRQGGPIQPLLTRVDGRIALSHLTRQETEEFIEEYLKEARDGTDKRLDSPLIPYTKDFVDYLYSISKGHPREMGRRCDDVIKEGIKDHVKQLTREYAKRVLARLNAATE